MWELLAPAGSYESILAAVNAGADAVYAGGRMFGARAYADNPCEEQLIRGIEYCHIHGRKLYLTVNTLLKERELEEQLYPYLEPYYVHGADGLIVQDFGVMRFVREHFPDLPVHASTQMTVTAPEGARMLRRQGVSRVVVARELSLEEIRAITAETDIEVEAFVHGAMCYSYSGQCLFSSLLGGRSGNRGRCAQPCRLPYAAGKASPAFLLSMKDMCALDLLPELLDAGIASLKIEGRMKRPEYTAGVVSIYRKYMDLCQASRGEKYHVEDADRGALLDLYNRGGFSGGYYHTHNGRDMMSMYRPNHMGTPAVRVSAGKGGTLEFTALEPLGRGDVIELAPSGRRRADAPLSPEKLKKGDAVSAVPGREVTLGEDVRKGERIRFPQVKGWHFQEGVLYRTRNAGLLEQIRARYLDGEPQERVRGELIVPADAPAMFRLSCGGVQAECSGEIAEPARSRPTDENTVRRQMKKTGNTPFAFDELEISLADGLFVPVAKLNELRREGLALLREKLLAKGRRTAPAEQRTIPVPEAGSASVRGRESKTKSFRINVLVTDEEQLEALLDCGDIEIDTVYLDSLIFGRLEVSGKGRSGQASGTTGTESGRHFESEANAERIREAEQIIGRARRRSRRCFLNCPAVLRERERAFLAGDMMQTVMRGMDGFLLHTLDELAYFQDYIRENRLAAVLAADDNLYAYNFAAAGFLREEGIGRFTLPAELNFHELRERNTVPSELNVYGYQALMQSAQCVVKNTDRCTRIPEVTFIRDRKNAAFPVLNRCPFCCNTIYNSVPLMLCGCHSELAQLSLAFVRFSFTIESREETARVLRLGAALLCGDRSAEEPTEKAVIAGTRGHFRRGVE